MAHLASSLDGPPQDASLHTSVAGVAEAKNRWDTATEDDDEEDGVELRDHHCREVRPQRKHCERAKTVIEKLDVRLRVLCFGGGRWDDGCGCPEAPLGLNRIAQVPQTNNRQILQYSLQKCEHHHLGDCAVRRGRLPQGQAGNGERAYHQHPWVAALESASSQEQPAIWNTIDSGLAIEHSIGVACAADDLDHKGRKECHGVACVFWVMCCSSDQHGDACALGHARDQGNSDGWRHGLW
mmetsp:Transcript_182349/g.443861  ORF Transcript_182349/g.443861 Transcript_182349/m.443861 type:complete len:239 (+) Transcript_182349:125-841(+)